MKGYFDFECEPEDFRSEDMYSVITAGGKFDTGSKWMLGLSRAMFYGLPALLHIAILYFSNLDTLKWCWRGVGFSPQFRFLL